MAESRALGYFSALRESLRSGGLAGEGWREYPLYFRLEVLKRYAESYFPFYRVDETSEGKAVSFYCHVSLSPKKTVKLWEIRGLTVDSEGWLKVPLGALLDALEGRPEEQEYWKCFLVKHG